MGAIQCEICGYLFDSNQTGSSNCPRCALQQRKLPPRQPAPAPSAPASNRAADPQPRPEVSARGPIPKSEAAPRGGWPGTKPTNPTAPAAAPSRSAVRQPTTQASGNRLGTVCDSCGAVFDPRSPQCTACGAAASRQSSVTPKPTSAIQTGEVRGGYYWTGTQWLMLSSPAKATMYYVRSIALAVVAGIIGMLGFGIAVVTNGEATAAFVIGGVIAGILLAMAVISLFKGESSLMSWNGIESGRRQPRA